MAQVTTIAPCCPNRHGWLSTSRAPIPGSAALSGRPGAGRATSSNCAVPACWLYSTRDLSCDVPSDIDATPRSRNRSTRGADDPDVRGVRDGPEQTRCPSAASAPWPKPRRPQYVSFILLSPTSGGSKRRTLPQPRTFPSLPNFNQDCLIPPSTGGAHAARP